MNEGQTEARRCVEELVLGWLTDAPEQVDSACAPGVRWWTPLLAGPASGKAAVRAALAETLPAHPRHVRVSALLIDELGCTGIVELRGESGPEPVLITSVLRLEDGRVVHGSTYCDVEPSGPARTPTRVPVHP